MSVYTSLNQAQIQQFITPYGLTELNSFSGISAGIENTNYRLNTEQGDFILTVYEHFNVTEAAGYIHLLQQLNEHEAYYPTVLVAAQQQVLGFLSNKPAALFKCLPGQSVNTPSLKQCQLIASALARLHISSSSLKFSKQNPTSLKHLQARLQQFKSQLALQDLELLEDELNYQFNQKVDALERGVIHADLFKDNALFVGNHLTGVLDFYAACNDCYLLDTAIAMNDWCTDEQGVFQQDKQACFLRAYQSVRVMSDNELEMLPVFLRRASLRFWISRLEHRFTSRQGDMTQDKNPDEFKNLLLQHRDAVVNAMPA